MKWTLASAVAVLVVSSWAFAQTQAPSPEQQIQQISEKLIQSYMKSSDQILQYIAEDALFVDNTDDGSTISTKAQIKKELSLPPSKGSKVAKDTVKNVRVADVKVKGNTAVSITRAWVSDGKKLNTVYTIVLTFAKHDGEWQIISGTQSTR